MPRPSITKKQQRNTLVKQTRNTVVTSQITDSDDKVISDEVLKQWTSLWSSFGFTGKQWNARGGKVAEWSNQMYDRCEKKFDEEVTKREKLLKESLADYEDILLRTGFQSDIEGCFEHMKLKEKEIYIEKKLQSIGLKEEQLLRELDHLLRKQTSLCEILNSSPLEMDKNEACSLMVNIEKLNKFVQKLNDLKTSRETIVKSYYLKVKLYSEQLQWCPQSDSTIEHLLNEKYDECLTADSIKEIETTIQELEVQIENQKEHFHSLRITLKLLYNALNILEQDYCSAYKSNKINADVIKQLDHEIQCCRQIRMSNGKEYCQTVRSKIIELYDKCKVGNSERQKMDIIDFEVLSPEVLDMYDQEYIRVQELYQKRKPIVDAYETWNKFWTEYVTFDKWSKSSARFHERGYNPMVEQQKRKKFQTELPKIEKAFLDMLDDDNDEFLLNDVPIRKLYNDAHDEIAPSAPTTVTTTRTQQNANSAVKTPGRKPLTTPVSTPSTIVKTPSTMSVRTQSKTPMRKSMKTIKKMKQQPKSGNKKFTPRAPAAPSAPLITAYSFNGDISATPHGHNNSLDFSKLSTLKNVNGELKQMTSTPNSSYTTKILGRNKTNNPITDRKARRSKRLAAARRSPKILPMYDENDEIST